MQKLNGNFKGYKLPDHVKSKVEHVFRRDSTEVMNAVFTFDDNVLIQTSLD